MMVISSKTNIIRYPLEYLYYVNIQNFKEVSFYGLYRPNQKSKSLVFGISFITCFLNIYSVFYGKHVKQNQSKLENPSLFARENSSLLSRILKSVGTCSENEHHICISFLVTIVSLTLGIELKYKYMCFIL